MRRSIVISGTILIILMVVACAEFMAYLKSRQLVTYSIGFTPLHISESYENYLGRYHPRLGWSSFPENLDAVGSRPIPAFLDPKRTMSCVSLYGDSFIEGFGVAHELAWSNILSELLNCRVANFGVSGYGTDQAFLRFLDNSKDQARVVILGFLSENLMRNVNQLRNLISSSTSCFIKPRFVLNEEGQLTLVPIPPVTKKEYDALSRTPERVLTHEFFLPGGPSGYQKMEFPYTWGIIKVFPLLYKNLVLHRPTYYDLYQAGHPSQAVEVTVGIMEEFSRVAQERGKQPLVLIIPTHFDLAHYRRVGKWVYQPLIDILVKEGVAFINVGPKFVQYLGNADLETLYSPKTQNHLNEKGNWLLAKIVYDYLIQNKFLSQAKMGN
jgi:hypothetical protein